MSDMVCARLQGHSAVVCRCRTADGFLACPDHALRVLTPTYPPAAYQRAKDHIGGVNEMTATRKSARPIYSGYTGNICDACGGLRMRRAGTCEVCDDCGNAGGCG
jgi:hypothetical protein